MPQREEEISKNPENVPHNAQTSSQNEDKG
jgi:hypothetical protein